MRSDIFVLFLLNFPEYSGTGDTCSESSKAI